MKALELADKYADACFDQALNGRTEDPIPEQKRDELAAELRRLAAVEASILQAILDPENQPSQYGTVTLEKHANKVSDLTDKYCALVDRLSTLKAERDALKAELERIKALPPVAMRYDFDGYGWQYIDNGSGSDWLTRHKDGEALYALGCKTDD